MYTRRDYGRSNFESRCWALTVPPGGERTIFHGERETQPSLRAMRWPGAVPRSRWYDRRSWDQWTILQGSIFLDAVTRKVGLFFTPSSQKSQVANMTVAAPHPPSIIHTVRAYVVLLDRVRKSTRPSNVRLTNRNEVNFSNFVSGWSINGYSIEWVDFWTRSPVKLSVALERIRER